MSKGKQEVLEPYDQKSALTWFKDGDFINHILNENNIPITKKFIENIFKKYGLNHKVKNLENFQLAMVHISYLNRTTITEKTARMLKDVIPISDEFKNQAIPLKEKDYGTLEFLGDCAIHYILGKYLFTRYNEKKDEGFMTKLRTKLEKDEALSKLSKILGLQKYAIVARNIEQAGGRLNNVHLTEDIFESFIGALSLEIPFDDLYEFVMNIMQSEMDLAELIHHDDNYKDRLMQYYHKMKWSEPKYYEDVSQHKNTKEGCVEIRSYTTYVKKPDGTIIGVGEGSSKPKSEQNAAYNSLVNLGVIDESGDGNDSDYYGEASDSDDSTEFLEEIKESDDSDIFEEIISSNSENNKSNSNKSSPNKSGLNKCNSIKKHKKHKIHKIQKYSNESDSSEDEKPAKSKRSTKNKK